MTTTATIAKKNVTLDTITADGKTYDATNAAVISAGAISGTVGSQTLLVSGSGTFADADAGSGKTVTVSDVTALNKADGTGAWSNYNLTTTGSLTTTATIAKKNVTVSANDQLQIYSGTPYVGGNGVQISGLINGDSLGAVGYGGNSQGAMDAGRYQITPLGLSNDNYVIGYVDGILTIYKQESVDTQQFLPRAILVPQFTDTNISLQPMPQASTGSGGLKYVAVTDAPGSTEDGSGASPSGSASQQSAPDGIASSSTPRSAVGPASIFVMDGGINITGYSSSSQ